MPCDPLPVPPGTRQDPVTVPSDEDVLLITVDAHSQTGGRRVEPPTPPAHAGLNISGDGSATGSSNINDAAAAGGLYAKKQAIESTLTWLSSLGSSVGTGGVLLGTAAAWLGKHAWHVVAVDVISELLTGKGIIGWAEDGLDALVDAVGEVKDYLHGGPDATVRDAVNRAVDLAYTMHPEAIKAEFPLSQPPLDKLKDLCAHTFRPSDVGLKAFCAWLAELAGDVTLSHEALRLLRSR